MRPLIVLCVLTFTVLACGANTEPEAPSDRAFTATTSPSAPPTSTYPDAFTVSRLSWEDASHALGYPLLHNPNVELTWPYLFVSPSLDVKEVKLREAEALYKWDSGTAKIEMAPEQYFGVDNLRLGDPASVGGRNGWLRQRRDTMVFKFQYAASTDLGALWCQVEILTTDRDVMDDFVAGLR